jgi:excisionase family DNA binding protein
MGRLGRHHAPNVGRWPDDQLAEYPEGYAPSSYAGRHHQQAAAPMRRPPSLSSPSGSVRRATRTHRATLPLVLHAIMGGVTLKEAAERLGLSPTTLRLQILKGKLKATKRGRDWWVTPKEVERYSQEHRR